MGLQALAYPFLFVAIFFEAFVLVTFLSKDARAARARKPARRDAPDLPSVAVIVPCWNEARTVGATVESLLALEYPAEKLEVVLVDNASSDDTPAVMARYAAHPQVTLLREEARGKHNAVNAGIRQCEAEIVGCLDADSFVEPSALLAMVPCFENPSIGATTAAMSVHEPGNLLQHMQNAEYIFGIARANALSVVHGIHVTPGPFSLYRRALVQSLGGFRAAYQTEDLEMALRLQRAGYKIANAPAARVYTKAPATVLKLVKQRTRWTSGYLRNVLNDYRDMVGSARYGALGAITLPLGMLAIGSGILLFALALYQVVHGLVEAVSLRAGIPLSYALAPHASFGWFYLPASLYTLLAALTVLIAAAMIVLGKRISRTPGSLTAGLFGYVLLYGLIAPLWLIRSTADVALGKTRAWR
ncbi:MAG TPA: glycosyltransferase [Candidatus Paceibacterota bacterium]|nr:glycosyltransferase [Candidatus Paceibacterota bacterium]